MTDTTDPKIVEKREAAQAELKHFLETFQTVILGSANSAGDPDASYAPAIIDEDHNFYVYVSALAKHTSNLAKTRKSSLMIIEDESKAALFHARKRLTFSCAVEKISRDDPEFALRLDQFFDKFGKIIEGLRDMADFRLFRLVPQKGRMVTGFGSAYSLTGTQIDFHMSGGSGGGHQSAKKS